MGYENEIYRLVLLSEREKAELVEQLRVLPGHKAKLLSLIDMIKEVGWLKQWDLPQRECARYVSKHKQYLQQPFPWSKKAKDSLDYPPS